jgi:hypothetical protein
MMGLEIEKRRITAHDVTGISSNGCLQEFVIIGIAQTGSENETGSTISE